MQVSSQTNKSPSRLFGLCVFFKGDGRIALRPRAETNTHPYILGRFEQKGLSLPHQSWVSHNGALFMQPCCMFEQPAQFSLLVAWSSISAV